MSDDSKFQFSIARLMHAMFWFGGSAALVMISMRTPIIVPLEFRATSPPANPNLVMWCLSAAVATLAAGVGALFGRAFAAALISAAAVIAFLFLSGLLLL